MKRRQLLMHLIRQGCFLFREGRNHSVFVNPNNRFTSTVPRHREINDFLANKICKDLKIRKVK